jgi:hypothetical protein
MIGKKINQLATELAPVSTDLTIIGDPISGVSKKITLAQLGAIFSGAVSFYTDLASFPATGDINVIYCAKDTQKLYLWSGSAYVEVFPSQALLDTYQLRSEKGVSNGYASLDSGGKVPISQLPSSIMEYKGTWNASTNTPTLANGTGDTGDVYICNVAGTVNFGAGPLTFAVGDYVIYSGTIWQRSSGAVGTVTSVAVSRSGDALAITGSPVTTSGTINVGFAGNSTQYINGAGNLVTFPGVINEAQNLITEVYNKTGATLTKGTVVYINGGQGNLPTITKALATGDSTSAQTYGIVRNDITNNNNGYVVVAGRISDLDTQAFTEGTQLYLSSTTAGAYTSTKQYAPNHLVYVGIVVRAHPTQGVVEVKIQNGYELDELHNVAAQTPTNNDGIFWEASTSLWKNKSIATILGYTPQAQLNGTGFVKASGTTISYDNSTYVTIDTFETITASKNFAVGLSLGSAGGTNQASVFANTSSLFSGSAGVNVFGFNSANNIYFGKGSDNGGVLQWSNSTVRYYTLPNATGTLALTSDLTGGTVTSVGLSSATSGVTIGSTPITTSGTITLAIATASGSQQGLLSSTDWTTFNNKQNALTNPVTGTGTTNYLPKFTGASTIGNSQIFDNGTNVGINTTTPDGKLDIAQAMSDGSASAFTSPHLALTATSSTNFTGFVGMTFATSDSANYGFSYGALRSEAGVGDLVWRNHFNSAQGTQLMRLTYNGNLGLGVTPSAWASGYKVAQYQGGFLGSDGTSYIYFGQNAYSDGTFKYLANGLATIYAQDAGKYIWYQAPSGTAGNAISFTQAMTLDASGNLVIGDTTTGGRLRVVGNAATNGLSIKSAGNGGTFPFRVTWANGTEGSMFCVEDNGRVGIGTTTPGYRFTVGIDVETSTMQTYANGTSGASQGGVIRSWTYSTENFARYTDIVSIGNWDGTNGKSVMRFFTQDASTSPLERMRITSGGRVGIGTNNPFYPLVVDNLFTDAGTLTSGGNFYGVAYFGNGGLTIGYQSSTNHIALMANTTSRDIIFGGWNGSTNAERMRISSSGQLLINMTSAVGSEILNLTGKIDGTAQYGIFFQLNPNTYTSYAARFFNSGSSTVVGSITMGTSSTSYNTSSDYRLKTDYKDFSGLDLVSKIKTYDYEWKADKTRYYGVIAHELQSVINYAVTGVKDGKEMQGVDYSKIVPVLIKSIQELKQELDTLKNK